MNVKEVIRKSLANVPSQSIFDPLSNYDMAEANHELAWLNTWQLIDLTARISTLDDPYYMHMLSPETYSRLLRER